MKYHFAMYNADTTPEAHADMNDNNLAGDLYKQWYRAADSHNLCLQSLRKSDITTPGASTVATSFDRVLNLLDS